MRQIITSVPQKFGLVYSSRIDWEHDTFRKVLNDYTNSSGTCGFAKGHYVDYYADNTSELNETIHFFIKGTVMNRQAVEAIYVQDGDVNLLQKYPQAQEFVYNQENNAFFVKDQNVTVINF